MKKVITYKTTRGLTVDLTQAQVRLLEQHGVWPKDSTGEEYCTVSFGLHWGTPSYTDKELLTLCGVPAAD